MVSQALPPWQQRRESGQKLVKLRRKKRKKGKGRRPRKKEERGRGRGYVLLRLRGWLRVLHLLATRGGCEHVLV